MNEVAHGSDPAALPILFITRNYPPKVGGLESYSFNLIEAFACVGTTHKITLSRSIKHLPWFIPYALIKAIYIVHRYSVRNVHVCDGLLAPVGLLLKCLTGVRVTATIHGLDITYGNSFYQKVIPHCVEMLDRVVCVSRSTREEVLKRTRILPEDCVVIPNGIQRDEMFLPHSKTDLRRKFEASADIPITDRKVLFTVGRLVKRKGLAWFVAHVMPRLEEDYVYLIAGDGPERDLIAEIIVRHHLETRVFLLGRIPKKIRNALYNLSDIFIMPNITVPNDVEGFGIAAIEAGSCGLPVVAGNIQGIRDAVIDGKTGFLIEERDVKGFLERIRNMDLKSEDVRSKVNEIFDWSKISARYRDKIF